MFQYVTWVSNYALRTFLVLKRDNECLLWKYVVADCEEEIDVKIGVTGIIGQFYLSWMLNGQFSYQRTSYTPKRPWRFHPSLGHLMACVRNYEMKPPISKETLYREKNHIRTNGMW